MMKYVTSKFMTISIIILLQQNLVCSKCSCENQVQDSYHKVSEALKYKLIAKATILVSSLIGICIPIIAKKSSYLNPENDFYFLIKAFGGGVILATGFIHILPDAFEVLTSPCIGEKPWQMFPFSSFVTMVAAIGTLIMEALIMGHHKRFGLCKSQPVDEDDETHEAIGNHVHSLFIASDKLDSTNRLRNMIVSQILELGIVLHSIILGISLGVTRSPKTIKPMVVVFSFHQFFEGIGLGESISQAQFKNKKVAIMVILFCLIFPIGICIGMGISKFYNESSPKSLLIVEGFLLSASAGVLINMALVDLVATDFMNSKMLRNFKLQMGASFALFVGMTCMSILQLVENSSSQH